MASLLTAIGITKVYGKGDNAVTALRDVSFVVERGELVIVLGPSGAGKTTLLNILGGMDKVTEGILAIDGENVAAYTPRQRARYRRDKIGFVFQFYNLVPCLTAAENVELATDIAPACYGAEESLEGVGLKGRAAHTPAALSGGEQQRVSLARALAKKPELILCDEPTGALDYQTGKQVLSLLRKQAKEEGKTVIIVTHNTALEEIGDHVIHIRSGEIVSDVHNANPKKVEDIEW